MYKLNVITHFSAAHRLKFYPGECERIHGHNYKIKVTVAGDELDELGMLMDLMVLRTIVNECVQPFDHRLINEVAPFDSINPTSENLANYIFSWLKKNLPNKVTVTQVEVGETEELSVIYSGT